MNQPIQQAGAGVKNGIKKLMIVAHPDDELIFGGSLLLEPDWFIISVTNDDNKIRRKEFRGLMKDLKQNFIMYDHEDTMETDYVDQKTTNKLRKIIENNKKTLKMIVTHNQRGEYGHEQHKAVHRAVTKLCKEFGLTKKLHYFKKGTKKLPAATINRLYELMKVRYPSQYQVLDRLKIRGHLEKQTFRPAAK